MTDKDISSSPSSRRFKPYPSYKDSGVEWLGKIPTHWGTDRLKYVVTVSNERSYDPESELPFIGLEHIESGTGRLLTSTEDGNGEIGEIESSSSHFRHGDILFGKLRPYLAKVLKPDFEGRCSTELLVLRCGGNIDPQNLSYQLLSSGFISWINSMTYGTKMPRANAEQIVNTKVPLASLPEQYAIAKFLDRQTAKTDALIAKKERLIELLQEKRTALITQAVTKGLDANVPMKDSGVEWLGKIPAHWEVRKWRYCCRITEGQVDPKDDRYRNRVMIAPNHIESGTGRILFLETAEEQGAISGKYKVRCGALIYSKIRPGLNKACLASGDWLCSADMYPVEVAAKDLRTHYVLSFILSLPFVRIMVDESMRVAMPKVNRETLAACPLLVPAPREQEKIVGFLDKETAKIDALVTKIQEASDRLKEYRTALISAAVTGKIDVREA